MGRGAVLAGAHTGNWELAACALARRAPLLVVAKRLSVGAFDAFAKRTRRAHGVELAEPEGALPVAQRSLARGGWVTMLIDQVPESPAHGARVSFLGQPALASRAPAALAWRSGAPLLVVAARRSASGRQVLSVLDAHVPPEGAGRAWIDEATRASTRALERFVLDHPTEWLWLHRRWRLPRPSAAALACLSAGAPLHGKAR
jgi:KDO2-lipid IV(A) lauroyltransferase